MAKSLNKATLIGHLGDDPEIKTMQSGDRVCNFSLATSDSWTDKASGEVKERTQWHRIVIFNKGLVGICEKYLSKGSKIYIEGSIETRSYQKDGKDIYTTEIVLRPYAGEILLLTSRAAGDDEQDADIPDDEIPY